MKEKKKILKKCLPILLFCIFVNNLIYCQNKSDSVLISINEAKKIALIINERNCLREENIVLDSIATISSKTIVLLKESLGSSRRECEELRKNYRDCMTIDTIRQEEIKALEEHYKKQRRSDIWKIGGGGFVVGVLLTLLIL